MIFGEMAVTRRISISSVVFHVMINSMFLVDECPLSSAFFRRDSVRHCEEVARWDEVCFYGFLCLEVEIVSGVHHARRVIVILSEGGAERGMKLFGGWRGNSVVPRDG